MAGTESSRVRTLKLHPLQQELLHRATGSRGEPEVRNDAVRVLVVEDDVDHGELVRRTLERQNFDVTVVADGRAGVEAVSSAAYAIVLLDYSLPGENGLAVLRELRDRGFSAPVVIVTAQGDERLAAEAMKAGGMDFVVKTSGYLVALPTVLSKVLKQHELALENRRLQDETQRRLREAEALVELAQTLSSTLELSALLRKIGQAAARTCDMDRCTIFTCDNGHVRPLVSQFADGRLDPGLWQAFQDGAGAHLDDLPFLAEAIRRRCAVVLNDPASDPRFAVAGAPFQPKALLVLPLIRHDEVSGALVLERSWREDQVTPAQVMLGATVASHVALVMENARLYEETRRALGDLKAAQERLVRGETLRALGELASGAAHHLNNLLAVIDGRVQLLVRNPDCAVIKRPLEIIDRAAKDGAEVVRRIQEFARTRPLEEWKSVDVNDVVRDVVEMTRVRWHDGAVAQGVEIDVQCELGPLPLICGHAAALREVVTNFMLNAVDALPRGGRITLKTWTDEQHVLLEVADTGIGMSGDVLRRAQEPFFTTKGVKSTGLGLSVNYGIVQQHSGELTIDSAEGRGTTVTVRLPQTRVASAPAGAAAAAAEPARQLRILLIDDELDVREAMAEMLESEGHAVAQAAGSREALERLGAGFPIDLVLTDFGMPELTGWDLALAVKARWPELPVGLITGWGNQPAAMSRTRAVIDFVLRKPLDLHAFREAVARLRLPLAPGPLSNGQG